MHIDINIYDTYLRLYFWEVVVLSLILFFFFYGLITFFRRLFKIISRIKLPKRNSAKG